MSRVRLGFFGVKSEKGASAAHAALDVALRCVSAERPMAEKGESSTSLSRASRPVRSSSQIGAYTATSSVPRAASYTTSARSCGGLPAAFLPASAAGARKARAAVAVALPRGHDAQPCAPSCTHRVGLALTASGPTASIRSEGCTSRTTRGAFPAAVTAKAAAHGRQFWTVTGGRTRSTRPAPWRAFSTAATAFTVPPPSGTRAGLASASTATPTASSHGASAPPTRTRSAAPAAASCGAGRCTDAPGPTTNLPASPSAAAAPATATTRLASAISLATATPDMRVPTRAPVSSNRTAHTSRSAAAPAPAAAGRAGRYLRTHFRLRT